MDFGKWLILGAAIGLSAAASVSGFVFAVNSTGDGSDLSPGDHVCQAAGGHCTLRAAIEEANTNADSDSIHFAIPTSDPGYNSSTGGWTINVPSALPDLTHDLDITGPGASKLIVRRSAASSYRIFNVTTPVSVSFVGLTISNGHSATGSGSGINNSGIATINITNCILSGHSSDIYGGAIDNPGVGTVNVNRCTISNNQAGAGGGGIRNGPTGGVTISNSTLSNNLAGGDMSGSSGGGVYNRGFMAITNSFFTDNTCSNYDPGDGGGGITNGGAVNITNSTFTRNSALNLGGGLYNVTGATMNLTNCTVSGNSSNAPAGGGGIRNQGTLTIKSTLVALNTAFFAPDVYGTFSSEGFNLIGKEDASAGFTAATDLKGTIAAPRDPKLDSDARANGGPTKTIALLAGSPAIDKGTSDGLTGHLTTDQRGSGFPRTFNNTAIANAAGGDGTDIGAFEVETANPVTPMATKLVNISTRAVVQAGDNVLIAGFIASGSDSFKVIVRAIGPSLSLAGKLADPILELHNSSGALIASNDNWRTTQQSEIIATGIPPSNNLESAIVRTLTPGRYTAIVRGKNNATGIALVEVYAIN